MNLDTRTVGCLVFSSNTAGQPIPPTPREEMRVPLITAPTIIGPTDGESVTLQTIGVRFMIPGADTDGRLSLVEHPMPPRALAAPLHRHNREDEYSFILEGRMGALLGDDVVEARPGRPGLQAPRPMAHVLESGRRAGA